MKIRTVASLASIFLLTFSRAESQLPEGWQTVAPRDEIRPAFSFEPQGGPRGGGSFVVAHDQREGLDGWFQKTFVVAGGE